MAGIWMGEETQERMELWVTRVLVLLSLLAHLTLALLSGIRRRRDSGLRRFLVWLADRMTTIGTPIVLGLVFLKDNKQKLKVSAMYTEQQMFALWAPFLLLHIGHPDNITSYALENKELSLINIAGLILVIGGALYGSYKQRFMHGDGHLRAAFFIMLFLGSYKCVERAVALHRVSFANIRRSYERKRLQRFSVEDEGCKQDNDDALLDAHGLLGVTMAAFAEYADSPLYYNSYKVYPAGWKYASKVVEMEASLMYDVLYTKASVIHTWGGYTIRVLSPLATATTLYLFHGKESQAMKTSDRMGTYILFVVNLVLDIICLLIALGSTWTYACLLDLEQGVEEGNKLLVRRRWPHRLKQGGCQVGRRSWHWLRRLLSQDPSGLSLRSERRLLPGSGVGQRNLLHDCSSSPQGRLEKMTSFFAGPRKKIDVKDELLEVMCTYLMLGTDTDIIPRSGSTSDLDDYMRYDANNYSFESNLIASHVATTIFLLCKPVWQEIKSEASAKYEKQIHVISDYMVFLLAQRQHMVLKPGDEGSHYKNAGLDLKEIWRERQTSGSLTTVGETRLANILLKMNATEGSSWGSSLLSNRNNTLALGAYWAFKLLRELDPANYDSGSGRRPVCVEYVSRHEDFTSVFTNEAQTKIKLYRDRGDKSKLLDYMLKLILDSWKGLLTLTSNECSWESHAKQLSCGGELLTIIRLMKQHGRLQIISKRE